MSLLLSLSCGFAGPSTRYLGGENLTGVFNGEGNIAVADLSNPRRLSFEHEGSSITCGWAYSAHVIRSLSGVDRAFDFALNSVEDASALAPGPYLVFVDKWPDLPESSTPGRKGTEADLFEKWSECWNRLRYGTQPYIEMVFPVVPGSRDERFRGPTMEENMIEILGVAPCGVDVRGPVFCVDDVRLEVEKIRAP